MTVAFQCVNRPCASLFVVDEIVPDRRGRAVSYCPFCGSTLGYGQDLRYVPIEDRIVFDDRGQLRKVKALG